MSFLFKKPRSVSETAWRATEIAKHVNVANKLEPQNLRGALHDLYEQMSEVSRREIELLGRDMCATNLFLHLTNNIDILSFESGTLVCKILSALIQYQEGMMESYLVSRPQIVFSLLRGHRNATSPTMAHCGSIIRALTRLERVAELLLGCGELWKYFETLRDAPVNVVSDIFNTLEIILGRHEIATQTFLREYGAKFTDKMNTLMSSGSFVTKCQSLKIMNLVTTRHSQYREAYISNVDNLRLISLLLRDQFKSVQQQSFNVFQMFVMNPRKPKLVTKELRTCRADLLETLANLNLGGRNSPQECEYYFNEKVKVIELITKLSELSKPMIGITSGDSLPQDRVSSHKEEGSKENPSSPKTKQLYGYAGALRRDSSHSGLSFAPVEPLRPVRPMPTPVGSKRSARTPSKLVSDSLNKRVNAVCGLQNHNESPLQQVPQLVPSFLQPSLKVDKDGTSSTSGSSSPVSPAEFMVRRNLHPAYLPSPSVIGSPMSGIELDAQPGLAIVNGNKEVLITVERSALLAALVRVKKRYGKMADQLLELLLTIEETQPSLFEEVLQECLLIDKR